MFQSTFQQQQERSICFFWSAFECQGGRIRMDWHQLLYGRRLERGGVRLEWRGVSWCRLGRISDRETRAFLQFPFTFLCSALVPNSPACHFRAKREKKKQKKRIRIRMCILGQAFQPISVRHEIERKRVGSGAKKKETAFAWPRVASQAKPHPTAASPASRLSLKGAPSWLMTAQMISPRQEESRRSNTHTLTHFL